MVRHLDTGCFQRKLDKSLVNVLVCAGFLPGFLSCFLQVSLDETSYFMYSAEAHTEGAHAQ